MTALSDRRSQHQKAPGLLWWDEAIFQAWSSLARCLATWSKDGLENPSLAADDCAKEDTVIMQTIVDYEVSLSSENLYDLRIDLKGAMILINV